MVMAGTDAVDRIYAFKYTPTICPNVMLLGKYQLIFLPAEEFV